MKHTFLLILIYTCLINVITAQYRYFDFDTRFPSDRYLYFRQDSTISNRDWQIGKVNKAVFPYDSTFKRGLCTDTFNSVNPGDTFSAIVLFDTWGFAGGGNWFHLIFDYKLDADSGDKAWVEISVDQGKSWINILEQDTVYNIKWWGNQLKPVLSGKQYQWIEFDADMTKWAAEMDTAIYPKILRGIDSVFYRFTFIAGQSNRQRDGWLIDNLVFVNFFESIHSTEANQAGFVFYPNPASESLSIHSTKDASIQQWQIYNLYGELVSKGDGASVQSIDVSSLSNGLYVARILSDDQWYALKFEIAKP